MMSSIKSLPNGIRVLVTTPHPVNFFWLEDPNGEQLFVAEGSGWLVNAKPMEKEVGKCGNATLLRTVFVGDAETEEVLRRLKTLESDLVIVGSIIAAQAYPGLVYGLVPAPGFERVEPSKKRMSMERFNTF